MRQVFRSDMAVRRLSPGYMTSLFEFPVTGVNARMPTTEQRREEARSPTVVVHAG
jgi:hypothetical protein